jgi:hypothetical protein
MPIRGSVKYVLCSLLMFEVSEFSGWVVSKQAGIAGETVQDGAGHAPRLSFFAQVLKIFF